MTPLETIVSEVLDRLRRLAETTEAQLSCNTLIDIVGVRSHILAILIFSVLNLLPGPPGYSVVIGLAIMAFSVMLLFGKRLRLWRFVGDRRLPLPLIVKLLEFLAVFTRIVSKFSSPRLSSLASDRILPLIAILSFVFGVGMLVPIPFTNTLPSLGLAIICVGILNRDGLALLIGVAIGIVGLVLLVMALWVVFVLATLVGETIQHELLDEGQGNEP